MEVKGATTIQARKKAGILVVPFWSGKKGPHEAVDLQHNAELQKQIKGPVQSGDFKGKEGEVLLHYATGLPEERLLLLGLGSQEDVTAEKLRKTYSQVTRHCHKKKITSVNLLLPGDIPMAREDVVAAIMDGLLIPNYSFHSLKKHSLEHNSVDLIEVITLIGASKADLDTATHCSTIAESVNMVRDLVNGNADDVTPQHLSAVARGLEKTCKNVKTTVFDKKKIEKEGMGLFLAVNRGSHLEPAFIVVEYKGNPKSKERTAIVGKGITFDTGGLNLKPTGGIEDMKCDMAGAATVLGVIHAISALGLKVNATAVIPSTENSISSFSYKPGDVYTGYSGKSVEIGNTDAEGRLALADALAYTIDKLKPSRIVDIATLTGSVELALGNEISGLYSNNDVLADLLMGISGQTGEWLCRLPLYEEYRDLLKSDIADIKSTGGRKAGSITAALFLKEFVGKTPWAHLDVAGTAYVGEAKRYFPKHATGFGVRLLVKLLEKL